MTLGNMRENSCGSMCRAGFATTPLCSTFDGYANEVPVPSFGPRMLCTSCGIVGVSRGGLSIQFGLADFREAFWNLSAARTGAHQSRPCDWERRKRPTGAPPVTTQADGSVGHLLHGAEGRQGRGL
jgi:hypothetical protein